MYNLRRQHKECDPYCYPDSDVLKNKFDIHSDKELDAAEGFHVAIRLDQLEISPIKGSFDLSHLQAIHHHIFQDVYEWAGEIRKIDIQKADMRYTEHVHIVDAMAEIHTELSKENEIKTASAEKFPSRLAYYFSEIHRIHPFREGNSRSTQAFFRQLSKEASYDLSFQGVEANTWYDVARQANHGNISKLEGFFKEHVKPRPFLLEGKDYSLNRDHKTPSIHKGDIGEL